MCVFLLKQDLEGGNKQIIVTPVETHTHLLFDVAVPTKCQPSECQSYEDTPNRQSDLKSCQSSTRDPQCQGGVLKAGGGGQTVREHNLEMCFLNVMPLEL